MQILSRVLLPPMCSAIAPNVGLLEPGEIHDEHIWPVKSLCKRKPTKGRQWCICQKSADDKEPPANTLRLCVERDSRACTLINVHACPWDYSIIAASTDDKPITPIHPPD